MDPKFALFAAVTAMVAVAVVLMLRGAPSSHLQLDQTQASSAIAIPAAPAAAPAEPKTQVVRFGFAERVRGWFGQTGERELDPYARTKTRDGSSRTELALDRPAALPRVAPGGTVAHDLPWYDSFVEHPGRRLTPQRMAQAFALAERGYPQQQIDLFSDLREGDGHARNLFEHRNRVVANKPLVYAGGDPSDEAAMAAQVLTLATARLPIKQALEHLLKVNGDGHAAIEMDWGLMEFGGRQWVVPVNLTLVPSRRFRIGVAGMIPTKGEQAVRVDELRLYQEVITPQGNPLDPGKWIALVRQPNEVARGGLMRTASPLLMVKRFSFRDLVILSQRYGIPFPIVKYDGTTDGATLEVALEILRRIGSDSGAAVHKSLEIELEDGVKVKDPMQYKFIALINAELSKLVNGSTLRNDNGEGGGSYGLGDVHDSVAWDEVRDDGEMVSEAWSLQVCVPFARYNKINAQPPRATIVVEPDLGPAEFVSLAVKVKNELGIDVSQAQIRQRTGMHAPINDADKAPGMLVQSFPVPAGGNP